jgi:hypothetical protein
MATAVDAQARAISSSATAYDSASMPAPPQRSGTMMPSSPSSPSRAKMFFGNSCLRSISAATGAISRVAKSRAVSWISFCSGARSKFMRLSTRVVVCR